MTSINPAHERLAIVTTMVIAADARLTQSTLHRAWVHHRATLACDVLAASIDFELLH